MFQRADLFEKLQAVQASQEELKLFSGIAEMHSQKFKEKLADSKDKEPKRIYTVRGSHKQRAESSDEEAEEEEGKVSEIDTSDMSTDDEEEDTDRTNPQVEPSKSEEGMSSSFLPVLAGIYV